MICQITDQPAKSPSTMPSITTHVIPTAASAETARIIAIQRGSKVILATPITKNGPVLNRPYSKQRVNLDMLRYYVEDKP